MIQINQTRHQKRLVAREQAKTGKKSPQHALNALLWSIVKENGGKLKVKCSELKAISPKAALHTHYDEESDSLIITAGTYEPPKKSNIVLPHDGLYTGDR